MAELKTKKTTIVKKSVKEAPKAVKKAAPVKTEAKTGLSVSVYGLDGKVSGKITLPSEIFAEKENPKLVAQAVRVYLANQRMGTSSTKTRGEVSGTTKKVYRQKGTGRARHGAKKAHIFVGGGIAFGPKPRDLSLSMPKKMKRKALFSALSHKLSQEKVLVVDFEKATGKTKEIAAALKNLTLQDKKHVMVVVNKNLDTVRKASRNIENVAVENVASLSAYGVSKSASILFVKETIEGLKETFLKGGKS